MKNIKHGNPEVQKVIQKTFESVTSWLKKWSFVCFLLGNSPVSEFCMPTLGNYMFHLHRQVGMKYDWIREKLKCLYRKRFGSKIFERIHRMPCANCAAMVNNY